MHKCVITSYKRTRGIISSLRRHYPFQVPWVCSQHPQTR